MQRTLLILLLFFSTSSAFSQINKGNFLVGGSGAFSSRDQDGSKSSSLAISPNVGYFFIDKLAGGVDLTLNFSSAKFSGVKTTARGLGVSPFVRYYILPSSSRINLFAEGSYGWGKSRYKSPDLTNNSTFNSYSLSVGPSFFVTSNIAVEFTAGYTYSASRSKNIYSNYKTKEKLFQIGVGFQIHLGGNKKK